MTDQLGNLNKGNGMNKKKNYEARTVPYHEEWG